MSLGNTYSNNTNKGPDFNMYSNYRMNNAESEIDQTCISFKYWKTNLCISIYPRKNTGNDEIAFDMDNGITIYLSHTKARILKHEIELFLEDPVTYNSVGVPSGQAAITISNGSEYGKNNPVITIRKVSESGEVVASFAYEFKTNYHYSIRNYDGKNFDQIYEDYKNIEIEQLATLLDEYCKAATNAVAFTVMDQRKYSATRVENKIDSIASALGVETARSSNKGNGGFSNQSYFNNQNNGNSSKDSSNVGFTGASIEDLE